MTVFPQKLVEAILKTCEERADKGDFSLEVAVAYFGGASGATAILDCEACNPHPDFRVWVGEYFGVGPSVVWQAVIRHKIGSEDDPVRRFCDIARQFQGEGEGSPPIDSIDPSQCPSQSEAAQEQPDVALMAFPELFFLVYQNACRRPDMCHCALHRPRMFEDILLDIEGWLAGGAVLAPVFKELEADFQRWVTARYGKRDSTNWRILLADELSECETRFETLSQLLADYQEAATGERLTPDEIEGLIQTRLFGRKPGKPRTLKERLEELSREQEAKRKETDR